MSRFFRTVTKTRTAPRGLLGGDPPGQRESHGTLYERLVRVSIKDNFYNGSGDQCRDFAVAPTQATAELMRSLGLLFKNEGAGFSVLYKKAFQEDLLRYLKRQANTQGQIWSRLSFTLTPINPYFVNRTEIPINTDTSRDNFYFTNQQAHPEPEHDNPRLNPGRYVSKDSRFDVVHVQVAVPITQDVQEVRVLDISGEVVICKPRCVPTGLLEQKALSELSCTDVTEYLKDHLGAPMSCASGVLYLDMDRLPADHYIIRFIDKKGGKLGEDWKVVYEPLVPSPLCLLDLLFTDPDGENDDIYPVTTGTTPSIKPVHYELVFNRRSTVWNYYVIPQKWEPLENLNIVDPEAPLDSPFDGPSLVELANGAKAYRFVSRKALPLEQQSRMRFQLRGRRASLLNAPDVLVDRLPVASAEQVLPRTPQRAHDEFRQRALEPEHSNSRQRVERLLQGLKPWEDCFSDIFVYV